MLAPGVKSCNSRQHPIYPSPQEESSVETYLSTRLLHLHLPLHLHQLLFLRIRQRPRYPEQQRTATHNPQRLAAKRQRSRRNIVRRLERLGNGVPGVWGEDVFEGDEPVVEGFGVGGRI
jgi:hypothetical protein